MKKVFVTGAGSAIAHEACKLWAARGYEFVLVDRDQQKVNAVAGDLKVRGATKVWPITLDLSDENAGKTAVSEATRLMGAIDLVLIAHGYLGDQEADEKDFARAGKVIDVNFVSAAGILTELTRDIEGKRMTVGVISSVAGDRGRGSIYIYGAAKGALTIFADGLRNRLNGKGVHVVTIKPGYVDTPMTKDVEKKGLLWTKPGKVAKDIVKAMDKKKNVIYTPWFWRQIMWVIKIIPEPIFKKMSL